MNSEMKRKESAEMRSRFAAKLRSLLATKKLTQADVARQMGTTDATISHWTRGKVMPRGAALTVRLARFLGTSVDDLFS